MSDDKKFRSWYVPERGWVEVPKGSDHRETASAILGIQDEDEARRKLLVSGGVQALRTWFQIYDRKKTSEVLRIMQDRVIEVCEDAPISCQGERVSISFSDSRGSEIRYSSWKMDDFLSAGSWKDLPSFRKNPQDDLEPNKRIPLGFEEADEIADALLRGMISVLDPIYVQSDAKLGQAFGSGGVLQQSVTVSGARMLVEFRAAPDAEYVTVSSAAVGLRKDGTPLIRIALNADLPISHYKKYAAKRALERAIRHEATHGIDPRVKRGIKPSYSAIDASDEDYANDPAEVKAWGNELIYDIRRMMLDDFGKTRNAAWRTQLRQLVEEWFKKTPYSLMNEKNRRRIIRDLYQSFDETVPPGM